MRLRSLVLLILTLLGPSFIILIHQLPMLLLYVFAPLLIRMIAHTILFTWF